jgi:fatty acid desaturase
MNIEQIMSFLLGAIIIGEAVLLFIGMILMRKEPNEWKTRFNINTLLIDIAFGMIILFNAFEKMPYIIFAVPVLIVTHLFREIEYFKKDKKSRFIFNASLFGVNTIKLIGLLGLLLMVLL